MTTPSTTSHPSSPAAVAARRIAIDQALTDIRQIVGQGPIERSQLQQVTTRLEQLAGHAEWFTRADFPPPEAGQEVGASTRYHLNAQDGDEDLALYLNSIQPGKTTYPHNHTTWAVIVAIEGQEDNRVYRRTDDGSDPTHAQLELEREVTVAPGTSIAFLPDDIHSIHVVGDAPTLHFHLYGKPLETLTGRIGIHPQTGAILNYNATQMQPSKVVA